MPNSLEAALDSFPGFQKAEGAHLGSHAHTEGEGVVFALGFAPNGAGRVARLVVDFIMSHMGAGRRLDSRTPVRAHAALACRCAPPDALFYACSTQQAATFVRMLRYASPTPQGPPRPATTTTKMPLSVLLSHAFATFDEDYENALADDAAKPSLGIWGNVLRAIGNDGLPTRDLPMHTVLSRRAARAVLRDLQRLRWIALEKRSGASYLRWTTAGRTARDIGAAHIRAVEETWRQRFGTARVGRAATSAGGAREPVRHRVAVAPDRLRPGGRERYRRQPCSRPAGPATHSRARRRLAGCATRGGLAHPPTAAAGFALASPCRVHHRLRVGHCRLRGRPTLNLEPAAVHWRRWRAIGTCFGARRSAWQRQGWFGTPSRGGG